MGRRASRLRGLELQPKLARCWLRRSSDGHWCGYVGVPVSHPLNGVSLYDVPGADRSWRYHVYEARVFENVKGDAASGWCWF